MSRYLQPYRLGMGYTMPDGTTTDRNVTALPFPGNLVPGVMLPPGINPSGTGPASGGPATTIVLTPNSGPIPPPPSIPVVAAAPTDIMAWLQGSMFGGIPNWVLVAGAAALLFMPHGGKK
jgi:hypothetical protein